MSALAQDRAYVRAVGDEPLPGYRLIAPLGMGGFGEVWKCLAPGGLHKAIKFVHAESGESPAGERTSLQQEYEAFERIKSIRHPFLLTLERVELNDGELVMVMELADRSLGNRYDECRAAGEPGIPRSELLSYMVDAAEALDVLGRQHGLQHLDVKPANLFLLGGHVKVGDYGLVARHKASHDGDEPKLGRGLTPKYVAPEILFDRVDARSDQYPLALVYQELLTGVFPYSGRTARQLLLQHASAEPDVGPLPPNDRETVRRALAKDPSRRFPTCLSFVKALLRDDPSEGTHVVTATVRAPFAPPQGNHIPPAASGLITQATMKSGVVNAEMTQRFRPDLPAEDTRATHEVEFERQHPGWKYAAEWPSSPRGRVVRASDSSGVFHFVHLVKLPRECLAACRPVLTALAGPMEAVIQIQTEAISFAIPERDPSLKEFLSKQKGAEESPQRRGEIRALLTPIAAALDGLHAAHGFAHGLLSPATVLQKGSAWEVALYGLGELLRLTRGDQDWIGGEQYSAPEATAGRAIPSSDQYSLALIYLELCGAWAPSDRRAHRPDRTTLTFRYDREVLLEYEQAAVKKAMAAKPEHRFRTCREFLAALEPPIRKGITLEDVRAVECAQRLNGRSASSSHPPQPERLTNALLLAAGADAVASWPSPKSECLVVRLPDGRLTSRFPVKLTTELALLKLKAFKDLLNLDLAQWTDDTYVLKPRSGSHGGSARAVELVVQLPKGDQAGAGEIAVTGRAMRAGMDESVLPLIEQFHRAVQNTNERRKASRFRIDLPIQAFPVDDELAVLAPISGKCLDVSATGFACHLQGSSTTEHVFVTFPTLPEFLPWALLAKVIRTRECGGGSVALAGRFVHAGK